MFVVLCGKSSGVSRVVCMRHMRHNVSSLLYA